MILFAAALLLASPPPPVPTLRLPATAAPLRYDLDLSVDPARDTFQGRVSIELDVAAPTSFLWLNGAGLVVSTASVAQGHGAIAAHAVATTSGFLGFSFDRPLDAGHATLDVAWTGRVSTDEITGLFRQEQDGARYLFTQFEELGARHVFPCFDEPAFKTPWRVTLRVPAGAVAASNAPVESEWRSGSVRAVRFRTTRPLPSYLVAFVVGPFEVVPLGRAGRGKTPLRILTMKGRAHDATLLSHAVPAILPVLESYFDRAFPFEKLDVVAVPTFSGAMENAGLITADEPLVSLTRSEDSVAREREIVLTAAHEMAHQWFGDMVTMSWWDDIWLNESFATWMEEKVGAALDPEWDLGGSVTAEHEAAMSADTLVTAREIRQPILSADDIVDAFDEITYDKGSAILGMFEASLGPEVFRRGVRDYLSAHEYGSARTADFLEALGRAAHADVGSDFRSFLDQPGVPVVSAGFDCGGGAPPRVTLEQHRLLPVGTKGVEKQLWRIPVCVRVGAGGRVVESCHTMEADRLEFPAGADRCPDWLQLRPHGKGYFRVRYEGDLLDKLLARLDSLDSGERVATLGDAAALFDAGREKPARALALAETGARSSDPHILAAALAIARDVDASSLVPTTLRDHYARWIRDTFGDKARELGWQRAPHEPPSLDAVRADLLAMVVERGDDPAIGAEATKRARAWLSNPKAPETDLDRVALAAAAWHGDAALFADFERAAVAAAPTDTRRRLRIFRNELFFADPVLFRRALAHVDDPRLTSLQAMELARDAFVRQENRDDALAWFEAHFDALTARAPAELSAELLRLPGGFCDAPHRDAVAAFFAPRAAHLVGGPRTWDQTLEEIDLCIARRHEQEDDVASYLRGR